MRPFGDAGVAAVFQLYSRTSTFEGESAIRFAAADRVPQRELRHCLALALTHHSRKKKRQS